MRHFPLLLFYILACLITWSVWVPRALAHNGLLTLSMPAALDDLAYFLGPPVGAIVVTWHCGGWPAVRGLLGRVFLWRVGWPWYAVALLARTAMLVLAAAIGLLIGSYSPERFQFLPSIFVPGLILDFVGRIGGHSGEEIGWRGYALDYAQARLSPFASSILVALLQGVWHLPLFFIPDKTQYGSSFELFLVWLIAISLLQTLLYNNTKGSLLVASVFHAALNTTTTHAPPLLVELDITATWSVVVLMIVACFWIRAGVPAGPRSSSGAV